MPLDKSEQDRIRDEFADDPRRGQVEQAAAERAALAEHGQDTAGPDKRLAGFGYETDGQRAQAKAKAAADRKAKAAEQQGDKPDAGKGPAPAEAGRRARVTREGN